MATQSEMTALCRLCLRFSPCMVPLFEALIGEKLLVEVIHVTVGIELDKSFDLPRQVCQDCIEKVNFMYDFQQDLIKCQSMLRMGKDKGDTKFGIAEQTIGIPSEENGIDARSDRSSSVRSESRDLEGSHDEVAGSVHEQIKLESVDIKQEPLDSHNDEMDDPDYVNDIVDFDDSEVQNEQNLDAATTKPNKCYICDTIIESKSELNDHLESHKNMLPFKCLQCSTEANPIEAFHVTALNKHFETHGFQYVCPHCPLRYRTPSSCVYHVRTNHDKNQSEYHCEICGKVFSNLQVYRNHVNAHKNVMTERFKCEPCQKTFHSSKSLRTHQKSLSHDAVIRKKGMGIIISESNENKALAGKRKRKHKAKVDDVEGKTTMSSEEYGASSSIVKMERNDIDDEKPSVPKKRKGYSKIVKTIPNKCHICDTILESKNELVEHLESHKQMLPYKCTQCSTEANPIIYTTLRLLNRHFETHCFNYPCPHCPLRYRNSDTLTYHVRSTHEEQTEEYQCETCGKVLTNVYAFRNHLVVHRNVMMQRYKCELCQKNFRSRHCLDKHQALHFKQQLRAGIPVIAERKQISMTSGRDDLDLPQPSYASSEAETEIDTDLQIVCKDVQSQPVVLVHSGSKRPSKRTAEDLKRREERASKRRPILEGCRCKEICYEKIGPQRRSEINTWFWGLTAAEQKSFICRHSKRKPVKRRRGQKTSSTQDFRRQFSYVYQLEDERGVPQDVCCAFFLNTLGYDMKSSNIIYRYQGQAHNDGALKEKRGRYVRSTTLQDIVRRDIMLYSTTNSHNLPSDFSARKMFASFKERQLQADKQSCSYSFYCRIMKELNIKFTRLGHEVYEVFTGHENT
ncbi:zinc finger and SCAN domain-containing protein 12-like isoform X2 [Toxorhynchites rutilus septentrionalis]|uniref:zinc finger and SCAN domain-containing protein 12-like isoform X2 n=1 Tax=Toxorhynchites rutilus septentrionalis TaxID=329112 RepID=UPI00247A9C31|nr:zinc finger and SCAN domain-containing protein 12-like isoform X2 [Toxorhynchites rutilus septentrionalis]